jgi:hypothetical protein
MPQRVGSDDGERKIIADIEEFDWHCMHIREENGEPPWTFTIGLYETWQHPELIITGLSKEVTHQMLDTIAVRIEENRPIDLSNTTDALLTGYSCCFLDVPKENYFINVGFARWYYQGNDFPLYQIVWPSKEGHFPWNPRATESFRRWQPVLGEHSGSN